MYQKYFQKFMVIAVFAVASVTSFAAQQVRFIQSLDESEFVSASSSAVSSSATQAQVAAEALTEQQLNREYRLVLPNGESMIFSVRLLRHAGFFKPIIEEQLKKDELRAEDGQKIADIPIQQYIATKAFDKENPHKITLKDLHNFLSLVDEKLFVFAGSRIYFLQAANAYYVSALFVASYFDIPILLESTKEHIIDCFEKGAISKNRILQLPDDIQTQVLSGYVEKSTIIKDFFNSPKRTADRTGFLGTSIPSPDGQFITSVGYDYKGRRNVNVKSVRTNKELLSYLVEQISTMRFVSRLSALNCSPDGTHIVFGYTDGRIVVREVRYNADTDTVMLENPKVFSGHTNLVNVMKYSSDGTRIVSVSDDWTMRVWNAFTGEALISLNPSYMGDLIDVEYSPDKTKIAMINRTGSVCIWDTITNLQELNAVDNSQDTFSDGIFCIRWSADGRKIIYATRDEVILWNWESGQKISFNWCDLIPSDHASTPILSTELSSDGTELSASTSTTTWTWDVPTPDLYLLTLPELELVEKIITEKTIPSKLIADSDDQSKKLYEIYESLSDQWKNILTDRFVLRQAPDFAKASTGEQDETGVGAAVATSATGAGISSSSAAASAAGILFNRYD